MATARPRALIEVAYEAAAQEYLRNLPLEHFLEATAQATQRKITLESLDLLNARRPEVRVFNELLVQYERAGERKPGQVVPDNMVVLSTEPIRAISSYNVPLEPERPFWTLEYVSKHNRRKDYDENFDKYEKELQVPYYLVFYPDNQELTLYRLKGKKYNSVKPNRHGRYSIPDLDVEVALLDGWVRYWYQGELLPLPADLQRDLDESQRQLEIERQRAEAAIQHAESEARRADTAIRHAEAETQRADTASRRAETATLEASELRLRVEEMERELLQLKSSAPSAPPRRNNGSKSET
jgi:Uma2 family endonuclease